MLGLKTGQTIHFDLNSHPENLDSDSNSNILSVSGRYGYFLGQYRYEFNMDIHNRMCI